MDEDTLADIVKAAFIAGVTAEAKRQAKKGGKKVVQAAVAAPVAAAKTVKKKKARKKSRYNMEYSKNFKAVQGKYKTKSGSWKKNGFKNAQKEAHKLTKRSMK